MACNYKHTKFQPPEEHFKCPECGAPCGDFCIDEPAGHEDCELLHDEDFLICYKCNHATSGKAFAAQIRKKLNMIPCSHCKGTGFVKKQ